MEPQDKNIEAQLQARLAHIAPPRELFEQTLTSVTSRPPNRTTVREASLVASPYQIIISMVMKRSYLVGGIATLVIVAGATVAIMRHNGTSAVVATTMHTADTATPSSSATDTSAAANTNTLAAPTARTMAAPTGLAETGSALTIDTAVNSILQSNDAVAAAANNESSDGAALNTDLQNYSNVNDSSYDSSI